MNSNHQIDEGSGRYGGVYIGNGGNDSNYPKPESHPNPRPTIAALKNENPRTLKVKSLCRQRVNALLHEMTALRSVANFTFVKLRKVPKLKRNGNEQMTQFPEMFGRRLE